MIKGGQNTNTKLRIAAGVLALVFLFFVSFTTFFLAHEANHDCTGEDCPICALILQCETMLRQLGDGTAAAAVVLNMMLLSVLVTIIPNHEAHPVTPVSMKVRMNN